jgi:hypothetical protein
MSIVSSTYSEGNVQRNGERWVTEIHTDSTGKVYRDSYIADSTINAAWIQTRLAERANWLNGVLADAEFEGLIDG